MALPDELFELIRSLTPSEKRYFKLHADKYAGGNYKSQYEKLYDALQHWPHDTYDEKEFKKKQKGKTFLKNLPYEKNYLKELLLKMLRNYHSENDKGARLQEMLVDIRLLLDKGLKYQVAKIIERAMRIAESAELYSEILLLHDFLLELHKMDAGVQPLNTAEMAVRERDIMARLQLTRNAIHLRVAIIDIHRQQLWKERKHDVERIMEECADLQRSKYLSRRAELSLLNVQQFYLVHKAQYKRALDITKDWLNKMADEKSSVIFSTDDYRVVLANYLLCLLQCEQFDLMPEAISKLRAIPTSSDRAAAESFRLAVQYELVYLLNKVEIKEANAMLAQIELGLKRYQAFISEKSKVQFRFNIALLFFLQKNYSTALIHINELYHISGRDERYVYTTAMARTMEWMCQSSAKNYHILDSSFRNLKRYFADRELSGTFFDAMFQLFGIIIKEAGGKPASRVSIKKQLSDAELPGQWEQLSAIVLSWI